MFLTYSIKYLLGPPYSKFLVPPLPLGNTSQAPIPNHAATAANPTTSAQTLEPPQPSRSRRLGPRRRRRGGGAWSWEKEGRELRPGRRRAIKGAGSVPPLGKEVSTGKGDCASTEIEGEEVPLRISQARLEG